MKRLVPDGSAAAGPTRSIGTKKFSCSTFMLYLGIEGTLPKN